MKPLPSKMQMKSFQAYGLNSGKKLYQQVNFYSKRVNRIAIPDTKKRLENKIKLFEFVIELLSSE
jgi:hypothetical protein